MYFLALKVCLHSIMKTSYFNFKAIKWQFECNCFYQSRFILDKVYVGLFCFFSVVIIVIFRNFSLSFLKWWAYVQKSEKYMLNVKLAVSSMLSSVWYPRWLVIFFLHIFFNLLDQTIYIHFLIQLHLVSAKINGLFQSLTFNLTSVKVVHLIRFPMKWAMLIWLLFSVQMMEMFCK